jgi:hypothetical protein
MGLARAVAASQGPAENKVRRERDNELGHQQGFFGLLG